MNTPPGGGVRRTRVCSQTSFGSPTTETVTAMVSPAQGALLSTVTLVMVSCALAAVHRPASTATIPARAVAVSHRSGKNDHVKLIGVSSCEFELSEIARAGAMPSPPARSIANRTSRFVDSKTFAEAWPVEMPAGAHSVVRGTLRRK